MLETVFILICVGLLWGAWTLSRVALSGSRILPAVWFAYTGCLGVLASQGFFYNFATLPPRLSLVVLPNLILIAGLAFWPGIGERLTWVSARRLIGFQVFRVLIEMLLFTLVRQRRLPEIMTVTGSNYDIFVGLTAPLVAWLAFRKGRERYGLALGWNLAGFAILTNTLVHGILSAPTRFQVFHTSPPNMLIAEFPWVWLPGFVVPCALIGHVLSFRQIRAIQAGGSARQL